MLNLTTKGGVFRNNFTRKAITSGTHGFSCGFLVIFITKTKVITTGQSHQTNTTQGVVTLGLPTTSYEKMGFFTQQNPAILTSR